jgi:hypothetical protein
LLLSHQKSCRLPKGTEKHEKVLESVVFCRGGGLFNIAHWFFRNGRKNTAVVVCKVLHSPSGPRVSSFWEA